MKIKHLALMGGVLLSYPALALQTYKMVDQQKTSAVLSKEHYTRIAVEDDRIQQIFGAEGVFDIQSDEERGQIFLKPFYASLSKPVSITIVTEGGLTQDIKLMPRDVDAQSILFKSEEREPVQPIKEKPYRTQLVELMRAMLHSNHLEDYDKMPLLTSDRLDFKGLEIKPLTIYRGDKFNGRIYTVKNISLEPLSLKEEDLLQRDDAAILLPTRVIRPKQQTHFYVISKTGRG